MRKVLKTAFIITPSAFSEGSPWRGAKLDPSFLPFLFTNPILYTEHRKLIYSHGKQMCSLDKKKKDNRKAYQKNTENPNSALTVKKHQQCLSKGIKRHCID